MDDKNIFDKKFTDEEIIKALEYCNADRNECDKCVKKWLVRKNDKRGNN